MGLGIERESAMDRVDNFIANIYRSVQFRGAADFRRAALHSLGVLIPFDGALWGSGNYETGEFHSVVTLGVRDDYPRALEQSQHSNPILPVLMQHIGEAIDMASVVPDATFYGSDIYKKCFARYNVERILSFVDLEPRSNIYTLISLYRFDRKLVYTGEERELLKRAGLHMVNAAMQAFFVHIAAETGGNREVSAAICDSYGLFYQAMPEFLDLIEQHFPDWKGEALPFPLPPPGELYTENGLCVETAAFGDLFDVRIREERPTDALSERDREIVNGVCKGMTFKEIARELNLAPSTVSNRLYRLYHRLGVTSRASLARLVHGD